MAVAGAMRMDPWRGAVALLAAAALVLTTGSTAGAAPPRPGQGPVETVVVQMADTSAHAAAAVVSGLPGTAAVVAPQHRYLLRVPASEVPGVLARLRSDRRVSRASVAQAVHATSTPNDPCYAASCLAADEAGTLNPTATDRPYLNAIGAPQAWAVTHGDGVTVAVLDSGVDTNHPDLAKKVVSTVDVCGCAPPGGGDGLGHGTHVTGILAANTDNGKGVASLGWGVKVEMFRVLDSQGIGNTADVATAIYEAVAAHVRVISMSLSNSACSVNASDCGPDPDEAAAVEYALAHNVVVVAAAGNDGVNSPTYPAGYPGVLSVAATDNNGAVQFFSQWGSAANIAAPGSQIVSTWPSNLCAFGQPQPCYDILSGTSMAAPQVAAAAALMIAHKPALSGPQITELLESTARPTHGGNPINGGLLNVPAALAAESKPPPDVYNGYDAVGSDGSVYSFGSTLFLGDLAGHPLNRPVVGIALRNDGLGYWLDATDGGVFTFGGAGFYGSAGAVRLAKPVVGMAATPDGRGYWLVASDGGIFTFGDAGFYGSAGAVRLAKPVVGMAATPDGRGYWLVASDGGIFTFGDASFFGSAAAVRLAKPVVGMAATPGGRGYWLVASDGGIFTFGNAGFHGSTGGIRLAKPVVGMTVTPTGRGYWLAASDGGIFSFGDARFWGSTGGGPIPGAITGVTS